MRVPWYTLLAACFLLPVCAAQTPALGVSALAAMQRESVDTVHITLGPVALGFLRILGRFGNHGPDSVTDMKLFHGLHRVEVRSYQFATDHAYRQADLDALRSQFTTPQWQHIIQARDRGSDGNVDIYCALKNHKITRVVIMAAQPREFSLVNIAGAIGPDQIGMLRKDFIWKKGGRSRLATVQ